MYHIQDSLTFNYYESRDVITHVNFKLQIETSFKTLQRKPFANYVFPQSSKTLCVWSKHFRPSLAIRHFSQTKIKHTLKQQQQVSSQQAQAQTQSQSATAASSRTTTETESKNEKEFYSEETDEIKNLRMLNIGGIFGLAGLLSGLLISFLSPNDLRGFHCSLPYFFRNKPA